MVQSASDTFLINDSYIEEEKRYCKPSVYSFVAYSITFNNNKNMDTTKFIKDNDLKWVRNTNTGAFGRIMQGKLRLFATTDRATLALLDDKVRTNGVQITDAEWKQLPAENF